jgi:hypothetical protein
MQGLQFLAASPRTEDLYFLLTEFEDGLFKKDGQGSNLLISKRMTFQSKVENPAMRGVYF